MKRRSLAALPLTLALVGLTPLPAQASHTSPHESLNCTAVLDVVFEPGLSLTPSKGTFATEKPGAVECAGMLQGQDVSGPGALSLTGDYGQSSDAGDTCSLVLATGTYSLTLPTPRGPVSEKGKFAEALGPTREGSFSAVSEDRRWTGTFDFSPTKGDCLLAPITAAQITLEFKAQDPDQPSSAVGLTAGSGLVAVRPHRAIESSRGAPAAGYWSVFRAPLLSQLAVDLTSITRNDTPKGVSNPAG